MKNQQQVVGGGGSGSEGIRQRVNQCLSKLSDRDTEAMAAAELDSIALGLSPDAFPPFLSAISDSRPTDKTPVRRHPLRVLSLLSTHHPASHLLPHLPRMLSSALRRLRDPDSSVRSALVDAVRSIAASQPTSLSSSLLRPLSDALLHEQDLSAQSAAALALSAAIDAASPTPDLPHHLQRLLPRLLKLLRSNAFKAKPALLSLLGSAAAAGGASSPPLLGMLVPSLVDFLASEDWAARKAAAEALTRTALSERDLLAGFKSTCISTFESRRFDKVKSVRDSMNRMLEVWKDIPGTLPGEATASPSSQSQSNSSLRSEAPTSLRFRQFDRIDLVTLDQLIESNCELAESASDGRFPASISVKSARKSRFSESRSPPPNPSPLPTSRKNTAPSSNNRSCRPSFHKRDQRRKSDWRIEVSVPQTPVANVLEEKLLKDKEQGGINGNARSRLEARRMLFDKSGEDKMSKVVGLKSAAQVVPLKGAGSSELAAGGSGASDELHGDRTDGDLSMIRMQLLQIENQQSSLLDLLQKFIGSSQNGLHSLETRVHGLEMTLDVISRDLAASSGRIPNNDFAANTCCRLPGADFLASKFWKRAEGRYSSRLSISNNKRLAEMHGFAEKQSQESFKWDKPRFGLQGGFVVNPLAEINPHSRSNTEIASSKMLKSVSGDSGFKHAQDG